MSQKAILLVHGMGNHSAPTGNNPGSFGKEFIDSTDEWLQSFSNHSADTLGSHVDIHEFNYNEWLDKVREKMADKAQSMTDRVAAIGSHYQVSVPLDLAGRLLTFESKFGDDTFFYTHWLDVIFYATMLGAKIRVDAGRKISALVSQYGSGNVSIIAHSLGTAVTHDTLSRLYRNGFDPSNNIQDLDPSNHRLDSVWMFANVSRLVNLVTHFAEPYHSVVKPGNQGCTNSFVNVRHALDVFTWLGRFDPADNGDWVPPAIYHDDYKSIVTRLILDANTHSFKQYLQDPKVVAIMLARLHPQLNVSANEFKTLSDEYAAKSINGAYAALEEAFDDFQVDDSVTWKKFLSAAQEMKIAAAAVMGGL